MSNPDPVAPAEADDIPGGSIPPVELERPQKQTLPLVLASPHSGRAYSEQFKALSQLDALTLRRSEDAFVDEVFAGAPEAGAPLMCATFPRAYVDPNREPWELDATMFEGALPPQAKTRTERVRAGFGTIPRFVATGAEIYAEKLDAGEAEDRIRALYEPYHETLRSLIAETHDAFGTCLLLDCHSMPSVGGPSDRDAGRQRPDIVLGDRYGAACAPALMAAAEEILADLGLTTARNDPYAGAFTTDHYGKPATGIHAIQVEVNRGLYMNERRIERAAALKPFRVTMRSFVERLGAAASA